MPKASIPDNNDQQSPTAIKSGKPLWKSKEMTPRNRIIALIIGDFLCFMVFVSLGSNQHGEGVDLLYSAWLALPFLAAWFLVSPFVGAFKTDIATRPTKMLARIVFSWLATWPVAMLFRWLLVDRLRVPAVPFSSFLTFAIVALFFNMGLLLLWRWPFALNNELRSRNL